ncbi:MAG: NAD(P)-dependent oxidoreductase [Candidatus Hydrogenedentes bacterium]|nr:NAD(P)-dependent oxidoreductase [Candidatus Hydrogenedentota bacterium]
MNSVEQVGIIGLGLVGKALASRFLDAGAVVAGYDIDPAARAVARAMGVVVDDDPRDVARQCSTLLLSLPNPAVIRDVLWGEQGIASACRHDSLILDTSTTDPADTVEHHERLDGIGIKYVDACLVGASDAIARGEAVVLVGDTEASASYLSSLRVISGALYFLGSPGAGNRAKLAVNLVLGLNRLVLAEGLSFGVKAGLDPAQLLQILKSSAAYSKVMENKGDRMLNANFEPVARISQHAKDVDLIIAAAEYCGARVPLTHLHAEILSDAIAAGWGELDNSAVIKTYTERG